LGALSSRRGQGAFTEHPGDPQRCQSGLPRPADNFKSFNDRDEHIVSAKWDHQVTEQTGYFVKAYYHDWWTDYTRLGMDTDGNVNIINDLDQWGFEDYGLNLTGRHVLASGSEILGGIDYQRYQGEDFVLRIDGQTEAVTAGFVQYRPHLAFSPSTHLALGPATTMRILAATMRSGMSASASP